MFSVARTKVWLGSRVDNRKFPLFGMWSGMILGGIGIIYYGGYKVADWKNEQMKAEIKALDERVEARRQEAKLGIEYEEPNLEFADEKPKVDRFRRYGLPVLITTSVGTMLYYNWDRTSMSMSLMKTRVLAQSLIIAGVVAYCAQSFLLDQTRSRKTEMAYLGADGKLKVDDASKNN